MEDASIEICIDEKSPVDDTNKNSNSDVDQDKAMEHIRNNIALNKKKLQARKQKQDEYAMRSKEVIGESIREMLTSFRISQAPDCLRDHSYGDINGVASSGLIQSKEPAIKIQVPITATENITDDDLTPYDDSSSEDNDEFNAIIESELLGEDTYFSSVTQSNMSSQLDLGKRINLSSRIENDITKSEKKSEKKIAFQGKDDRATSEQVLDPRTRLILFKLLSSGFLEEIDGCLSTGKEANVYYARGSCSNGEVKEYAVKIFKTSILVFKDRDKYVSGEYRFRNGYCKSNPRRMVRTWAEKEMRNLKRLVVDKIPCPEPHLLKAHVLIMDFIGTDGWCAPRLKDVE